jgi:hypothetical protein
VRKASRIAFVSWVAVAAMGCAAVTGLDNISESDCAPNCNDAQAKQDVTNQQDGPGGDTSTGPDVVTHPDSSSGGNDSSLQQDTFVADTSTGDGEPQETSTGEGGKEAGTDAPVDAPKDSPAESSCGATDTPQNCGACGQACTATNGSNPQCASGTTCTYTCNAGYLDCNVSEAPDLDGCECHSPGATQANCGNGTNGPTGCCPVQHTDGLSEGTPKFFDCNPAGQYSLSLAIDACTEFTGNASECTQGQCVGEDGGTDGDLVVCSTGSTTNCPCWTFAGPNVGYEHDPHAAPNGGNNCYCADKTLGDTTYN